MMHCIYLMDGRARTTSIVLTQDNNHTFFDEPLSRQLIQLY